MDAYYDSDDDVCWGPITRREVMRDLLHPPKYTKRRHTVGVGDTPPKDSEDDMEDYCDDLATIIDDVSKLTIEPVYHTANQTLQSQNNFIEQMSEILGEDANTGEKKLTLIDLTDSTSEDENLTGTLENIIEKLNAQVEENNAQLENSRYTCTQAKYEDISEVFEDGQICGNNSEEYITAESSKMTNYNKSYVGTLGEDIDYVETISDDESFETIEQILSDDECEERQFGCIDKSKSSADEIADVNVESVAETNQMKYSTPEENSISTDTISDYKSAGMCTELEEADSDHDAFLQTNKGQKNDESYGIIRLSTKNLEHTLFLSDGKTPTKMDIGLHRASVIEECAEEDLEKETSDHFIVMEEGYASDISQDDKHESSQLQDGKYVSMNLKEAINAQDYSLLRKNSKDEESKLLVKQDEFELAYSHKYIESSVAQIESEDDKIKSLLSFNNIEPYNSNDSKNLIDAFGKEGIYTHNTYKATDLQTHVQEPSFKINEPKICINLNDTSSSDTECQFDDTMEEITRALELGLDYSMSNGTSECEILDTPKQICEKSKTVQEKHLVSESMKTPKPKCIRSKLPVSTKFSHIISPISVYCNTPTYNSTKKQTEFKKPMHPATRTISPMPRHLKNSSSFLSTPSPVSHYIKNTPTAPLQQNMHIQGKNTNKKLHFTPTKSCTKLKENIPSLPPVIYRPPSKTLVNKEKEICFPANIEKCLPFKGDIVKHQGRLIKHAREERYIEEKLLKADLTIEHSLNASGISNHDVSVLTSKKAFIK